MPKLDLIIWLVVDVIHSEPLVLVIRSI